MDLKQQQDIQHMRRLQEGTSESLKSLTQENVAMKSQILDLQARLAESAAMLQHQQVSKGASFEKLQSDMANATRMIRTLEQVCPRLLTSLVQSPPHALAPRTSNH
jgi:predicted  nucleic acid-binding Zn-ribbon protein